MIPLFKVRMSDAAGARVSDVLASGYIGQGPRVEQFEDALWRELRTKTRPITVNSCTSAIDLALHLLGVGADDEVISSPQTCFASQVGIIHRGARIRWADIDPVTGLMDAASVKTLIGKKTKAILAVNWAGRFCDYRALKSFGVPVIEDAAHCWEVFLEDPDAVERGDYVCYSFQAIKFLTCADGGALIAPNEQEERARLLRWYGLDRSKGESFRCAQNIAEAGFKYHMNDVAAAIGLSNLSEARAAVQTTREHARHYSSALAGCRNLQTIPFDATCSYWLYTTLIKKGAAQDFIDHLDKRGIAASPVHHRNDLYDCTAAFREGDLPGVDAFYSRQVNVPVGWWLSDADRAQIIAACEAY